MEHLPQIMVNENTTGWRCLKELPPINDAGSRIPFPPKQELESNLTPQTIMSQKIISKI